MSEINRVLIMGNLVRDPEVRKLPDGIALCAMRLAVNRRFTDREGNAKEDVCFVDVDAYRGQAETCGKYLHRASSVLVEGRLKMDQWDDAAIGKKQSRLKIVADNVHFLGQPRGEDGNENGNGNSQGHGNAHGNGNQPARNIRPAPGARLPSPAARR